MSAEISCTELQTRLRNGERLALLEVLPESYFASGHLPGALNLPLSALPGQARGGKAEWTAAGHELEMES